MSRIPQRRLLDMEKESGIFIGLHLETSVWFTVLAWIVPVGIFVQFLNAGLGLFFNKQLLVPHSVIGKSLSLPVVGLLVSALLIPRLRSFLWRAVAVLALYLVQVGLAIGSTPMLLSLHPANAALLLMASLLLLVRIEHRRTAAPA